MHNAINFTVLTLSYLISYGRKNAWLDWPFEQASLASEQTYVRRTYAVRSRDHLLSLFRRTVVQSYNNMMKFRPSSHLSTNGSKSSRPVLYIVGL